MKYKSLTVLFVVLGFVLTTNTLLADSTRGWKPFKSQPKICNWSEISSESAWGPRMSSVSFAFGNKVWIMGGYTNEGAKNDIWYTGSRDGTEWKNIPLSLNSVRWSPRAAASGIVFKNKIWVMGGYNAAFESLNDVWSSHNGENWNQTTEHAQWSLRHGASAIAYNVEGVKKMWIMGGGKPNENFGTLNDVWSSTDGANWTQEVAQAPWTPRRYSSLVEFKGKMFLLGGLDAGNNGLNDVWSSTDGITWTQEVASAPWVGRGQHQTVVYNNKLWVMGGTIPHYPPSTSVHLNDVWSSSDGVNWTQEADASWAARELFSSVVSNSNIWVMGGAVNIATFSDVWKFN